MTDNTGIKLSTFFGSKRIGTYDRLGSAKFNTNGQQQSFYPYGEDRGTIQPNDSLKFATYTRDTATGLDYADQRYYANNFGRFMTPDPYHAAAGSTNDRVKSASWNRYAYVQGDPVNLGDRRGTCDVEVGLGKGLDYEGCCDEFDDECCDDEWGCDPGGGGSESPSCTLSVSNVGAPLNQTWPTNMQHPPSSPIARSARTSQGDFTMECKSRAFFPATPIP